MNRKRWDVILLAVMFGVPPLFADNRPANEPGAGPVGSYTGEAAEAVVGRMFGVEGDAADIKYHLFEITGHTATNSAIRSGVLPGWGQHFNGQPVKGTIFFLTTIGAALGSLHLAREADDSYDDYKAIGQKDNAKYDDYEKYRTQSIVLGSAAVILWVMGMTDAYRNAYQRMYSKNTAVDVAYVDGGATVRINKNF